MSSNAKRNCTETGSNVDLPKNISRAFSCKINKTKAQLSGGTKEPVENLLFQKTKCRPIAEWGRELMTEDKKRMRNMMSALFCCKDFFQVSP